MASALQLNSDTALALVCATTALRRRSSSPIRVQHRGGSPAPQWPLPSLVTVPRPVAAAYMAGGLYGRRPVAGGLQARALTRTRTRTRTLTRIPTRYKELEPLLRQSVDTFRAYPVKAVALPGGI